MHCLNAFIKIKKNYHGLKYIINHGEKRKKPFFLNMQSSVKEAIKMRPERDKF